MGYIKNKFKKIKNTLKNNCNYNVKMALKQQCYIFYCLYKYKNIISYFHQPVVSSRYS